MGTTDPVAVQVRELVSTIPPLVRDRNLEGVPLFVYGHSWTMMPNPYTTPHTGEYQSRLAKRLQLGSVSSFGRSGAYMVDMACAVQAPVFAGSDRRFIPGSRGIVTLQCLINDLAAGGADPADPANLEFYKLALRTFLAAVSAAELKDADAGTYTGTWTTAGASLGQWYPAGKLRYTRTPGATASWTVTGDTAWVNTSAAKASTGANNAGNWTARVNGKVVGSFYPRGLMPEILTTAVRGAWGDAPVAVKLTGLNTAAGTSGAKTVTITVDEPRDTFLSGVLVPSKTPPRVFVALEAPRNPAASGLETWNTWEPVYRQAIIDVCAEFPNAATVDLAPGWENPAFIGSRDAAKAHPNDLGMAHIAGRFEEVIRATITAPDPGVLSL